MRIRYLGGHVEVLEWMQKNGALKKSNKAFFQMALLRDNVEVLQWLKDQGLQCEFWNNISCNLAARWNDKIFMWLVENGCPWDRKTAKCAAKAESLRPLQLLKAKGYTHWTEEVFAAAAFKGQLEGLIWLRGIECPFDGRSYLEAVRGQEWIMQYDIPRTPRLGPEYADDADIHLMTWLKENGCPWSAETCSLVAHTGNLKALKWMRENGCSWDSRCIAAAKEIGNAEMLQWLIENGCPSS